MSAGRSRERGVSLVEVAISVAVLAVMALVITQTIRSLSQADAAMRDDARTRSLAERIVEGIEVDVRATVRMFAEDDAGRGYFGRCNVVGLLGAGASVLPGSKLPIPLPLGTFAPDTALQAVTGNALVLGRRDGVLVVPMPSGSPRRVDMLRLVAWFLHGGGTTGVDLSRFTSARMARSSDVSISDPELRTALLAGLYAAGVRYTWDDTARVEVGVLALTPTGGQRALATTEKIAFDPALCEARLLGKRNLGIAKNRSVTVPVPRFAVAGSNFPHGFEIKRDGDGSGDLLLVRVVVATSGDRSRRIVFAEATRQVSFRSD